MIHPHREHLMVLKLNTLSYLLERYILYKYIQTYTNKPIYLKKILFTLSN